MSFQDDFPAEEIMVEAGDPMSYFPQGGGRKDGFGRIRYAVDRVGSESYITERVEAISWARAFFDNPRRGDEILIRGETYRVQALDRDDGIFIWVVVS